MEDLTIVFENNNEAVTSSRLVAEYFGKRHSHILRDIENLKDKVSTQFWAQNFLKTQYQSQRGEKPEYLMTKDGFTILAMGFTGAKAMQFKEAYINAFNKMQNLLKSNDRIMQLEQRILTLEEAKEPFNNFSDESILIDFFKAIKSEIDRNNYYLINDKDTEYTGQLLGIETYTTIYLIGNVAYNIYQTHTKAPVKRPTLSDLFQLKQIIVPSKTHGNLTKKKVGNKNYLCFAFLKDRIQQYL